MKPPENARAARQGGPHADDLKAGQSHAPAPAGKDISPGCGQAMKTPRPAPRPWRRERDRLLAVAMRTRRRRDWLAAIIHQAGIVARMERRVAQ